MRTRLEPGFRAMAAALLGLAWIAVPGAVRASDPVAEEVGLAQKKGESEPPAASGPEPSPAAAEMLRSMREKGLLTEDEYEELYRRQARYETEHTQMNGLPGWLKDWTFGGDVRFRVEGREFGDLDFDSTYRLGKDNVDVVNNRGLGDETRARLRLRLGAEKKVVESLTFGFRVATSSESTFGNNFSNGTFNFSSTFNSDPRSPNVTFGDFFSSKSIFIDRAYVRWAPDFARTLSVTIGKFANPFVSDQFSADFLVFDNDIQPEGAAARYRFDFLPDKLWLDTRGGFFTIQERSSITLSGFDASTGEIDPSLPDIDEQNPFLLGIQTGIHTQPVSWVRAGARVSYYDIQGIGTRMAAAMEDLGNGGAAIDNNPLFRLLGPTNPLFEDGSSSGRTKELVIDANARFTPWGERWAIAPFFQWMSLINADSENQGWAVGADLGNPDLLKITVMYASIGRNATVSLFTDSDAYEGFTNAKGWYVAAERNLWRGVRLRGAFMRSKQLRANCDLEDQSLALCDTATQDARLSPFRETTLDRYRWQLDVMVDF
jgi:hypothetical protein